MSERSRISGSASVRPTRMMDRRAKNESESPREVDSKARKAQGSGSTAPSSGKEKDPFLVELDEFERAPALPFATKCFAMLVVCSSALCVTCASSMAASTLDSLESTFHVGVEPALLTITLYIFGLGLGPLLFGGLSEFVGRNLIYRISLIGFFLFNFPVAFGNHLAVHLVFRFVTGFAGSAFLSLAGGTIADMFVGEATANAVALYTLSPFIGPVVGPIISGFINNSTDWRWTYYTLLIWSFVQTVAIHFVPETYAPTLTNRKAERLRRETGDERYYSPFDTSGRSMFETIKLSVSRPFELMTYELLILLLNIWTSLVLGIIYLAFAVFPAIFEGIHHFTVWQEGLAFLGMGLGQVLATASQPWWNALNRRTAAHYAAQGLKPPPETMLYQAMVAAVLAPIGLFAFAFTVYPSVHWAVPIIMITPFGAAAVLAFTSTFGFFVRSYRPVAASAMASNSFMRSAFAGAFPLVARPMFDRMGNVGALAFLAGMMTLLAPVPFIFYRYGPQLRKRSRFAVHE
ncbi:MFS general substrate transporter [Clavulina sp. PMI_390]|nr:MFS general substrate transporter [Clavulina sp. PMI_390]